MRARRSFSRITLGFLLQRGWFDRSELWQRQNLYPLRGTLNLRSGKLAREVPSQFKVLAPFRHHGCKGRTGPHRTIPRIRCLGASAYPSELWNKGADCDANFVAQQPIPNHGQGFDG